MPGVFEICVEINFSAAHSIDGYLGDCARIHGHNWIVTVYVRCRELNEIGIGIDFREVKKAVREVVEDLDHSYLNELPEFRNMNPSSENIARLLYSELARKINTDILAVSRVKVSETRGTGAFYWEE